MKRILIVDDIEENLYLLRVLLEGHNYAVDEARNGGEAIANAQKALPDLIISDILMPVIDGFTLCRIWKADGRFSRIPFIFYTATYTDPRDEQLALDIGADAFIVKPTEPDEFMRRVENILELESEGKLPPPQKPKTGNETILKNYNEALIRKLEHKMLELEKLNKELENEISEKNKIESTLRESEELFSSIFHQHKAVKLIIDPDTGSIIDANDAAVKFYGWTRDQLLKMKIHEINILPEAEVNAAMESVSEQKRMHFEFCHRRSDGSLCDVEVFSSRIQICGRVLLHSIIHDITDRKIAETSLHRSEERFRKLHESMIDAFVQIDMSGKITAFNNAYLEMLGYSAEEILGLVYTDLTPETWHTFEADIIKNQILPRGFSDIYEKEYRRKDGTIFPVELRTSLLNDDSGKPTGMWAIVRDITRRKKDENELLLRSTAMENAANAIMITDKDAIIQYVNPAFEILTGYMSSEAVGNNPWKMIKSGQHDKSFYRELLSAVTSGRAWSGEMVNKRKDGSIYTEDMTIAPVKNAAGEIQNYVAVMQNITEKKFASDLLKTRLDLINFSDNHSLEELMTRALDEAEKFTESSISFFHFLDDDQKTLCLQAWSTGTLRDYCKAAGKGSHLDTAKAGVWADCVRAGKTVVHNDYMHLPGRNSLPEGHAPVLRELVTPVFRNGIIKGILGLGNKTTGYNERDKSVSSYIGDILWDIIERKRSEENLKLLNTELEEKVASRTAALENANKELESFSYSVSHDLRAPLRHISGFLELLKKETESSASEKTRHYIDVISNSAGRMELLIKDLLSFSQMKRTLFSSQRVNMDELLSDVLDEFSEEMKKHNTNVLKHKLPHIQGDKAMLRVVLVNLISNAVKFSSKSPDPLIETGCGTAEGENVFYIRDNGAGFDMKHSDKLFSVFKRLHNERDYEGTGIGLAMVRSIIERHDGRVWAESGEGKGACFYFTIPDSNKQFDKMV